MPNFTHSNPASAADARDEIREYLAAELERPAADIQAKVVFNATLPWIDGRQHDCYLVEWFAGLHNGVALAGPYTHNFMELNVGEARQLGPLNEWRQQLINLYAGCEIAASKRLSQPFVDVPDPRRAEEQLRRLQNPTDVRVAVRCSLREFLRVNTDEYYIFNGDWVHNPHYTYSPDFGFRARQDPPVLELPADQSALRIAPHRLLQPVPPVTPDGVYPGQEVGFIMVKNGRVIDATASAATLPVLNKVAMYYLLGQEEGPFAVSRAQ